MRKIVQIAYSLSDTKYPSVVALCDDNTLWVNFRNRAYSRGLEAWDDWEQLPALPQPEPNVQDELSWYTPEQEQAT